MLRVTAVFEKSANLAVTETSHDTPSCSWFSHFTTVPLLVKVQCAVVPLSTVCSPWKTARLCRLIVNLSVRLPWIKCICQFIGSCSTVGCLCFLGLFNLFLFFAKAKYEYSDALYLVKSPKNIAKCHQVSNLNLQIGSGLLSTNLESSSVLYLSILKRKLWNETFKFRFVSF